jgi:hypothetical protein
MPNGRNQTVKSTATRELALADRERIRAHLNLYALLQNLEELVRLDDEAAEIVRPWNVSVQFSVRHGPSASLTFCEGKCIHQSGRDRSADVSLHFFSPRHLNATFDGRAIAIPLRGFTRLAWLRRDFGRLTRRLESYLKPTDTTTNDTCETLLATLLAQTGAFAAGELARLEPTCRKIAARIPDGILSVEISPDGPGIHVAVSGGEIQVGKSTHETPSARLTFRHATVATALLRNRLDPYEAIAQGDLGLAGQIGMIEDFMLILDRVEQFLA